MPRVRKLPVEYDAHQWNPGDLGTAGRVVGSLMARGVEFNHPSGSGATTTLAIHTLEGVMVAQPGDWVIIGNEPGEAWPVRGDIFARTYEVVDRDELLADSEFDGTLTRFFDAEAGRPV